MVSSTPWPHFIPWKYPVPILQEAGWFPGPVWTGGKSRPHRDSIPDRPAHSQSLDEELVAQNLQGRKPNFQEAERNKILIRKSYTKYSMSIGSCLLTFRSSLLLPSSE